jgi:hypothetical protein
MRRFLLALPFLALAAPAHALVVAPSPLPERVALAKVVIVGKVKEVEKKPVEVVAYPGEQAKSFLSIAVVEITDGLVGVKGVTSARVAFTPPPSEEPLPPGRLPPIRRFGETLDAGFEGVLFLTPHHDQDFYMLVRPYGLISKKDNPDYDKQLAQVKHAASLLADPLKSLEAKDANDRFLTAAMLVTRYRTQLTGNEKTEPIDAKESKLILQALHDADWDMTKQRFDEMSPMRAFGLLQLTEKDGWKPRPFKNYQKEFPEAAKAWLKENLNKHRIQKFILAPAK